jgi:ATP-binding cassette subfamily B multidrug efflux pump
LAYKWAIGWMGKYKKRLVLAIIFNIIGVGLMTWEPYILTDIIDDVLMPQKFDLLLPMLIKALIVGLLFVGCRYLTNILAEQAAETAVMRLKGALFRKLMTLPPSYYRENKVGDIINKCTGDVEMINRFLAWVVPKSIEFALMLVVALVVFMSINWQYTLALICVTPFSALIAKKLGKKLHPAFKAVRKQLSKLNTVVQENISGNRVVKAFVREDFEIEKFQKENIGYKDENIKANLIWLRYGPIIDSLASLITVINLTLGAVLTVKGMITLGELNLFLTFAWALNEPMLMLGMIINEVQRFKASIEKVRELYYYEVDITDPETDKSPETVKGDISFEHVSLSYGSTKVLDDLNFEIKAGQTVGIMGPTGSGKTTLANVIARFTDITEGSVKIDGVDVRDYPLSKLRGSIGLTTQDVFLFSDTVESNIAYGCPDTPMENVINSAVIADAHGFVSSMQEGYDTIVGERGTGLSGGQKQRISLARALAKNSPILILDDTTSAVDMETEQYIQEALRNRPNKCTTIIIAQRVSSVRYADNIIILDRGHVLEQGSHKELMKLKGYYYNTCAMQHGLSDDVMEGGEL